MSTPMSLPGKDPEGCCEDSDTPPHSGQDLLGKQALTRGCLEHSKDSEPPSGTGPPGDVRLH